RAANCEHLLLPTVERPCLLTPALLQSREALIGALNVTSDLLFVSPSVRTQPQVIFDGKLRKSAPAIRNVSDAQPDYVFSRPVHDGFSVEANLAACAHRTAQCAQRRGFARTVGTQDCRDAAT